MWCDFDRPFVVAALLLGAPGCSYDWMTDMWYQPSIRPEQAPRPEPEHSVPLGAGPAIADRDEAEALPDPVAQDADSVRRGAALFVQRCVACHGPEGHGGGPVSRYYPPAPDLAYGAIRARSDGYIFGTITFGGRAMPPMGEGLTARDRWDLVSFVRSIKAAAPTDAGPAHIDGGT